MPLNVLFQRLQRYDTQHSRLRKAEIQRFVSTYKQELDNGEQKMKVKYSVSIIAAAIAMFSLSIVAPAFSEMKEMPMNEHRMGHGHMMEMGNMDSMGDMSSMCIEHAAKMGLTDEQIAKMKPLHIQMQKKQAQFKADQKIAELEKMEIMDVKDFDLEKAGIAVKKINDIKTAYQLEMLKGMKEMRTILTEDQFNKMKKMMMKYDSKKPAKKMMKK
jgi:hypothetical protein